MCRGAGWGLCASLRGDAGAPNEVPTPEGAVGSQLVAVSRCNVTASLGGVMQVSGWP